MIKIYNLFSAFYTVMPNIPANAKWVQKGITVAGRNGWGSAMHQLNSPYGLAVDEDQTVVVVDWLNHRIIQWKKGDTNGKIVAGGNGNAPIMVDLVPSLINKELLKSRLDRFGQCPLASCRTPASPNPQSSYTTINNYQATVFPTEGVLLLSGVRIQHCRCYCNLSNKRCT